MLGSASKLVPQVPDAVHWGYRLAKGAGSSAWGLLGELRAEPPERAEAEREEEDDGAGG